MKWQSKAKIMAMCAILPMGNSIYQLIQRRFGNLNGNPFSRINMQLEMAKWILQNDMVIIGRTVFEVGTGHKTVVPIGFFLSGAEKVITVDINRRLNFNVLKETLASIAKNRHEFEAMYQELIDAKILNQRLNLIEKLQNQPKKFLMEANIQYLAPTDAAHTKLQNESVDYHISTTVLEHIPINVIESIFVEAKRILRKNGAAIHFIDLSDHFQHQDKSITKINFLSYPDEKWFKIAGNDFAYCNRIRASEYLQIFRKLSFTIRQTEAEIDQKSMYELLKGFKIDDKFLNYTSDDICTTQLKVMLKKA